MKVVSIVGARPQFIKIAGLSAVFRRHFEEVLVHTGQHYDYELSEVFFQSLQVPTPDFHLEVGSGQHGAQTGQMLERIEKVLIEVRPDWVVVVGDTNSTLAGALAAVKLHIPVAHVEAGLRSYAPMPEEVNRRLTDHVSALLLTPTDRATETLRGENVTGAIHQVGDVLVETVLSASARGAGDEILATLGLAPRSYWLATLHRAELTDDPTTLETALRRLALFERPVVFPMHPRTRAILDRLDMWSAVPANVRVIKAVDFFEMLALQRNAAGIATDSGGVQREAYLLGVPCLTVRDETEWPETLVGGWNHLVGRDGAGIPAALAAGPPSTERPPAFGRGDSADQIARLLLAGVPGPVLAKSPA
jgi:UDP-N-acetylglucosamine 2-epimerase